LAKHFKVSQIVILRRLLDTSLITKQEFIEKLKDLYEKEKRIPQGSGGDFYHTIPHRLSKRFLYILNNAVKNNTIQFRDALRITNLSAKSYDNLFNRTI
jgi:Zn-dependent peptidase ImmA (M78 family)